MPDLYMDVDSALAEVPVNLLPLLDDTDFKTREVAVAYNAAGMDLVWNFVTTAGAFTQTAVTPTTAGDYDWTHQGDGMYTIEIPASAGASINNDTEGVGWFSGVATGVLPWRGPTIGFRAAGLNDALIDSAWSATRGLAGTALPAAAADAAGGLPISDVGGLDLDAVKSKTDLIPATPAATGDAMTLTTGERDAIAAALLDLANGVETNLTLRQTLQLVAAATAGVLSGAATAEITIRAARNSGTTRITATVDADGNRSAITYNL